MTDSPAIVTRWWWVRHAPVVDAHLKRLSGQADVDADVSERAAVRAVASHLPHDAVWVTSHLKRTRQTAEALWAEGAARPNAVETEPDVAEQAFGDWTGLTWAEVAARPQSQDFWDAPATVAPPHAQSGLASESFAAVCARVAGRIEALTEAHAGRDIVCMAHAGSIRAALALALSLTPEQALGFDVKNLGLTRLDHLVDGLRVKRGGHWRVVGVNQGC